MNTTHTVHTHKIAEREIEKEERKGRKEGEEKEEEEEKGTWRAQPRLGKAIWKLGEKGKTPKHFYV